jgi:hypothetical protein
VFITDNNYQRPENKVLFYNFKDQTKKKLEETTFGTYIFRAVLEVSASATYHGVTEVRKFHFYKIFTYYIVETKQEGEYNFEIRVHSVPASGDMSKAKSKILHTVKGASSTELEVHVCRDKNEILLIYSKKG